MERIMFFPALLSAFFILYATCAVEGRPNPRGYDGHGPLSDLGLRQRPPTSFSDNYLALHGAGEEYRTEEDE